MQWREGKERLHHCWESTQQCTHNTQFCTLWAPSTLQTALKTVKPGFWNTVQKYISLNITETETCKWRDQILLKIAPLLFMFILNTKPRILIYYNFFQIDTSNLTGITATAISYFLTSMSETWNCQENLCSLDEHTTVISTTSSTHSVIHTSTPSSIITPSSS